MLRSFVGALGRLALRLIDRGVDAVVDRTMTDDAIRRAASQLDDDPQVLVFAGSGLSVESGVPTFRGEDGMFQDDEIARLTRAQTFHSDRERMMEWYQARRDELDTIEPNPGHRALIELAAETGDYTFATQNVDHLLEAAADDYGYRPPIHHLHGSLLDVRCNDCGNTFEDLTLDLSELPSCEECGGPLRPGVVWFGEALPTDALEQSRRAAQSADACLIVGTSGLVQPAASLPRIARRSGATLIEINPNSTALSEACDITIRGEAGSALPTLLEEVHRLRAD